VKTLLGGSVILPVFVLLELKLGLLAGGIADLGGLMVIIGLIGMLVGILRYSGHLDAAESAR
jgi:CheY-specific phosphatase CheX